MLDRVLELHNLWIKICLNLGASIEDAEDIVQDLYLRLQTEIDISKIRYGKDDINRYYIYKMLKSMFIDTKRNKLLKNSFELNDELGLTSREDYEYAKDAALEDIINDIKKAISDERVSLQRLFELYFKIPIYSNIPYEGESYSYEKISKRANISKTAVFETMKEIKSLIRSKFGENIEDWINEDYDRI